MAKSKHSEDVKPVGPQRTPIMTRGVSQLLFTYLPERTVDWEDGLAIVKLGGVRLESVWGTEHAKVVLEEVAQLLDRWRGLGGTVDDRFPDPRRESGRFAVGLPVAIEARVLETAYLCQACNALIFPTSRELAGQRERGLQAEPLRCSACGRPALRQFGQVFVHGCGELLALSGFLPITRTEPDGQLRPARRPLKCSQCTDGGLLELPARSERVSEMKIVCRRCRTTVVERLTARCPRCTLRIARESPPAVLSGRPSIVARIAMRMSRYSANDTYYAQTVTLLRLDRSVLTASDDPEQQELRLLLPPDERSEGHQSTSAVLAALSERLRREEATGDKVEQERIRARIAEVAIQGIIPPTREDVSPPLATAPDIPKMTRESLAYRTTVRSHPVCALAYESSADNSLTDVIGRLEQRLGLREVALVDDLPVIAATFGYTRRAFQPTYDELGATGLSTEIRVLPSLDSDAARRAGRMDLVGAVPILAREGEHQGLFLGLDHERVLRWLERNGAGLSSSEAPPLTRILTALEPIDRYYDTIWSCRIRRLVFGLLHSLSHAAMRAASWFAGLERTSLSEYIFLPLLGTVVFDTSGSFQLGGIEALARDHLTAFLEALPTEALACVYDADCIDSRGACHGCIHSPEIACRVFNHGLSRALLIGGHAPWQDVSVDEQIVGYWQVEDLA